MKRKPILLNKIKGNAIGKGREVIGLIGSHHGTGVTYTGLMLSFYMGEELGRKTAFLECNEHKDFKLIRASYEWSKEQAFSFSFHQITCHEEVTPYRIPEIFGEDYECIILDFGTDLAANREEFLRCGTKIVIGGRSDWDILKLARFKDASKTIRGSDSWLYFIPQANENTVIKISNELKKKVWSVPAAGEPVIPSHSTNRFFEKIFPSQ
jgi:hypothetical protein